MRIYRKEGAGGLKKATRREGPKRIGIVLKNESGRLEMENTHLKALAIELGEELPEGLDIEPYPISRAIQSRGSV